MAGRFPRIRRLLPPVSMVLGLFLFGLALALLGSQASPEDAQPLNASTVTSINGTSIILVPLNYLGYYSDRIDVNYTFPLQAGNAYVLDCTDAAALAAGHAPEAPLLQFSGLRSERFVVSYQTLPPAGRFFWFDEETGLPCDAAIAFTWAGTDPATNKPSISVLYYEAGLEAEDFTLLAMLMAGSALLTLLGGLAWARGSPSQSAQPPAEGSTVETLRASLDQVLVQLERTRKNLLFAGILGVFLWYPFIVPWAWRQADRASTDPGAPWAVAGFTLLFLIVLTILWAREFLRLDRQLASWRTRLGELRTREDRLMETLEHSGG